MGQLSNKVILVTGASSGIGRATCIAISKEGGTVILTARSETGLQETVALMKHQERHLVIPFDLCELDNYVALFEKIKTHCLTLNGLVHCAGIAPVIPLRTATRSNIGKVFDLHYMAFIELVKFYAKKGVSDGGSIVAISSINAHVPQKCMTAYASAKAAVETACRTLALELTEKGIRINSLVVGGVQTNMSKDTGQLLSGLSIKENAVSNHQLLGCATPDQIAAPILFLLSEQSSFITGRELYADGGWF